MWLHQLDGLAFDLAFEIGKSELVIDSQKAAVKTQGDKSAQPHLAPIDTKNPENETQI
jgi:hypothetical protein